jgi:hypothetical protein
MEVAGVLEMAEDTWQVRDLPVLDAAVRYFEDRDRRGSLPQPHHLAPMVGMDVEDVSLALDALRDEYLDVEIGGGGLRNATVKRIYPSARRAVGQWPTPENLAERILVELQRAAETEQDEEKRSKLRQTATFLGSSGKDLLISILAAVIARSTGIA